jgi:nitroreductase
MEFYDVIERRRTVRVFKKGIPEEQLQRILGAGAKAPSAGGRQPWEFILIEDPEIIRRLSEVKYQLNRRIVPEAGEDEKEMEARAVDQKRWFQNSTVVAVCSYSEETLKSKNRDVKLHHDMESVWLCIENLSLAAVAEGIGSGIISFWGTQKEEVEKILTLPEGCRLAAFMKFGEPGKEVYSRERRPALSWIHRNRF